jgi:hypothetical protein
MRSRAVKHQYLRTLLVDQHPVRLNVATAATLPLSYKGMVYVLFVQGAMVAYVFYDFAELGQILATLFAKLRFLLECRRRFCI